MEILKLFYYFLFLSKIGLTLFCALCAVATSSGARTVDSHLGPKDLTRLQKVFVDGLSSNDLQAIFFSSLNIETTDAATKETLCKKIVTLHAESKLNVSSLYPYCFIL